MTRPIKYRTYDKNYGMVYDPGFMVTGAGEISLNEFFQNLGEPVFMQFTGLTDKSGKEIYEGDIVRLHGVINYGKVGDVCKVVWESRYAGFAIWHSNDEEHETVGNLCREPFHNHLEVIGNIYENPELLETKP